MDMYVVDSTQYARLIDGVSLPQAVPLLSDEGPGTVNLYVNAQDGNSGLAEMQVSTSAVFSDTTWEPYSALRPWTPGGEDGLKTVYVRFRDNAGNVSTVVSTTFALDTLSPLGHLAIIPQVVGPQAITVTLYLGVVDNLSGVTDVQISADSNLSGAVWQAYTPTLVWPIYPTGQSQEVLYAQYRDLAGNVSQVYSATTIVDSAPPEVYVEVPAGSTLTRTMAVEAYDELAEVATIRLSNDPRMIDGLVTLPYTNTVTWTFDERRVVWVQVEDSVGNASDPYPAYASIVEYTVYLPLVVRDY
jgi:hypothetical protein